jgi:hypothetical protein
VVPHGRAQALEVGQAVLVANHRLAVEEISSRLVSKN